MNIVVGIATAGRAELLPHTIAQFGNQTRLPDAIYVCPAKPTDYDLSRNVDFVRPIKVVSGGVGLPAQRNVILDHATEADVIVFFDDDFVADPYFLSEVEALLSRKSDLVVATGDVIADGINGPGIRFDEAIATVQALPGLPNERLTDVFNAYGCNMIVRVAPVRAHNVRFDEVLPLYGWWEDVDFSRQMAPYGRIMKSNRLRGVHMGSKSGRTPGQRLGYSQVANIVYMMQKGTIPLSVGLIRISRNVIANLTKLFKPEPWVDRRGRFVGNMKAIKDCVFAPADPQKTLKL